MRHHTLLEIWDFILNSVLGLNKTRKLTGNKQSHSQGFLKSGDDQDELAASVENGAVRLTLSPKGNKARSNSKASRGRVPTLGLQDSSFSSAGP